MDERIPILRWALRTAGFVLIAVLLELAGSAWANSPTPAWAGRLLPLSWPPAARVVWWLAVAVATGVVHIGAVRAGAKARPVIGVVTVGMFLGFAVGIALGAEWAIWH